jgi:hypothetical protein
MQLKKTVFSPSQGWWYTPGRENFLSDLDDLAMPGKQTTGFKQDLESWTLLLLLFFSIALKPKLGDTKSLLALHTSQPWNHCTFL